jgi:3-hydroxyacyl-[acyl-carrier-protein] dehydratase
VNPRTVLPHRYPMLLVDRVDAMVPGASITASKAVTVNEPWYRDAGDEAAEYPPAYPPVLLMESWAQSAGILAVAGTGRDEPPDGQVMLFGGAGRICFLAPVYPGDVVRHDARLTRALGDSLIFEGESRVGDDLVMTVERMVMAMRPASVLRPHDPVTVGAPAGGQEEQ